MISTRVPRCLLALLVVLAAGCDRLKMEETAKVRIALPSTSSSDKISSQGTLVLAHVVVNVTGPGISAPVYMAWDRHDSSASAAPESFEVTIPSGNARLVQLLAAYEPEGSGGGLEVKYGDVIKDISGTTQDVDVALDRLSNGSNQPIVSGRISGRYFTTATGGPTDFLQIRYSPGSGKPSLLIEKTPIINGWFNALGLTGADFEYVLEKTGERLWNGPKNLFSPEFVPLAANGNINRVARADVPVHVANREESGTQVVKNASAEIFVWGYWGPAAVLSDKYVCFSDAVTSTASKVREYRGPTADATTMAQSPGMAIDKTGPLVTNAADLLMDAYSASTPQKIRLGGGATFTNGSCGPVAVTASTLFTQIQKINPYQFDEAGGDRAAGFRGYFANNAVGDPFTMTPQGSSMSLNGNVLPGVTDVFSELKAFKRISNDGRNFDSPDCARLAEYGFSSSGSAPITAGGVSLDLGVTAADRSNGVSVILCPVKVNGELASLGTFIPQNWFSSYSGGGSVAASGPPVMFNLWSVFNRLGTNQCHLLQASLRSSSNGWAVLSSPQNFVLSVTGASSTLEFFSDPACSSKIGDASAAVTISQPVNTPDVKIWMKTTGYQSSFSLAMSTSGAFNYSSTMTMSGAMSPASPMGMKLRELAIPSLAPGQCWETEAYLVDSSGGPANAYSNMALGYPANPSLQFLPSCSSSSGTIQVPTGAYKVGFTIKNVDTTAITANTIVPLTLGSYSSNLVINPVSALSSVNLSFAKSPFGLGVCEQVTVIRRDAGGVPLTNEPGIPLHVETTVGSGADIYGDSSCGTSLGNSANFSFASNGSSFTFWVKMNGSALSAGTSTQVSLMANAMSLTGASIGVSQSVQFQAANTAFSTSSMVVSTCHPFVLNALHPADGGSLSGLSATPFNFKVSSGLIKFFPSSTDCGSTTNEIAPATGSGMDDWNLLEGTTYYAKCQTATTMAPLLTHPAFTSVGGIYGTSIVCGP